MNNIDATADTSKLEKLIRRFSNATFDCDIILKQVTECKAYVTACRATADEPDAHKYNLTLLVKVMQIHGFTQPDAVDAYLDNVDAYLDNVDAYLDNIDQWASKIRFDEQQALNAVMRLPFVLSMLGDIPDGMDEEIAKTTDAASKERAAADQQQREIIVCRMFCDIERIAKRWAVEKANSQSNAAEQFAAMMEQLTNLTNGQAAIYEAIGIAKQQSRARQSGLTRENAVLKATIAALKP